jgi:hypothetical protein
MGLNVDLSGSGALANASLADDQDRAVTFGNSQDGALGMLFNEDRQPRGRRGFRRLLQILDGRNSCHGWSCIHPWP